MAAFVLVPHGSNGLIHAGERLNLFPGSATPAVFTAGQPFWIGYGFVEDREDSTEPASREFDDGTRFELLVDGAPAAMTSTIHDAAGTQARRDDIAEFPSGLSAGWHEFAGRWYDAGRLILSSRATIQFVEP
jgi:hypothetical protein